MLPLPVDIFTEPEDVSPDSIANLGPLRRLAGTWRADKGIEGQRPGAANVYRAYQGWSRRPTQSLAVIVNDREKDNSRPES